MKRISVYAVLISLFLLTGCVSTQDEKPVIDTSLEQSQRQPNLVLILIDDLSHYGFTTYGADVIRSKHGKFADIQFSTPNIDKLAEQGIRIENAFTHPLCENTRIALMSGKQNNRNYLKPKSQHASDITFSDVFKRAGYTTGMFGKWKQTRGTKEIAAKDYISEFGWDEYVAFDVVEEGQRFINPNLVINGELVDYRKRTDLDPETGRRWYGPDIYNRHVLNFIEKNQDKPFFLYYPMALVHDDHKPTPDTKPNTIFDQFDEWPNNRNGHTGDDPKYIADMIEYTDKLIGKLVTKLDQLKLREDTLIIVMGDNGTKEIFAHVKKDGTVYPARKGGNTDNGIHVGMVLSQPGTIEAGQNTVRSYDGLVYLTDVFPTMAEAAGVAIPKETRLDGMSFWPQMLGETKQHRRHIYSWYIANGRYDDIENNERFTHFAFNKSYKYYGSTKAYPDGRFFDLTTDPLERAGDSYIEVRWGVRRYSGLDINKLTPVQRQAYVALKQVVEDNKNVDAQRLIIHSTKSTIKLGTKLDLNVSTLPFSANRDGVIWVSSDPSIASVNKFGEVTTHKTGKVNIDVYSWSDAKPLADGKSPSFLTSGITDRVQLTITK
ncbi:sulfatase-like hydrolase/transferase [Catenovulum maritimum]|uniref:Sulfatase n=1 Tax=Catenovulum maritimum TaxID=1513271 RepID=A0A0J8GVT5_9ALTE|nr:sulfatase-like hydrolase/transferase [Catenovulum maritimum]KMT66867.1 sulfatase [Catenovulum maritimum]